MRRSPELKHDRMFERALDILEGRSNGRALPILHALALRRHAAARLLLSDLLARGVEGRRGHERSLRWLRLAAGQEPLALYNLAIEALNGGSLGGYRHWLARAARADPEARKELRRFQTRFSHDAMRRWRRLRPETRDRSSQTPSHSSGDGRSSAL
jgi:TPR repeat protein